MLKKSIFMLALATMLAVQPAAAQSLGPNGGLLAGPAGHQTELVVGATELTVFLIDHGKPHSAKGVTIRAIVQQGEQKTTLTFERVGDTKLVAKLAAPLAKGAIVVLTGKDDHGDAISSRYVIN